MDDACPNCKQPLGVHRFESFKTGQEICWHCAGTEVSLMRRSETVPKDEALSRIAVLMSVAAHEEEADVS